MQEISIILGSLGVLYIYSTAYLSIEWFEKAVNFIGKPLTCITCLSIWLGVLLSICFFNPIYLSLPILYNFLNKN